MSGLEISDIERSSNSSDDSFLRVQMTAATTTMRTTPPTAPPMMAPISASPDDGAPQEMLNGGSGVIGGLAVVLTPDPAGLFVAGADVPPDAGLLVVLAVPLPPVLEFEGLTVAGVMVLGAGVEGSSALTAKVDKWVQRQVVCCV